LSVLRDPSLGLWFVASIVVWSFFNMQDGLLTGLGRATIVPLENGVYAVAKLLLLAALVAWAGHAAIFISWTVPAALIVVGIAVAAFGRLIPAHAARAGEHHISMARRTLARFLAFDYAAYVLATITATVLPTLVVAFAGGAQGAYFYIPWVILTSLMLVPVYLSTSLTVHVAGDTSALGRHTRPVFIQGQRLLIPAVALIVVFAPLILALFGDAYAAEGSALLRVGSLGLIPYAVNVLYLAVARVSGRGGTIVAIQAVLTVLTLGLSVVLLPMLGLVGVGLAWLAANLGVAVVLFAVGLLPLLRTRPSSGLA
jgi:O-antigen/teichoic acid export membrane protein